MYKEALLLLSQIRSLSIATIDGQNKPQVRIIDCVAIDDFLYFVTARGKDFYQELTSSQSIGITGLTKEYKMVRMEATASKVDRRYVDLIIEKNPGIGDIYYGKSRRILEAFCIKSGSGEIFDLSELPIVRTPFAFGSLPLLQKGFDITEKCIRCGACARSCPQNCIEPGTPFTITQQNCLHCGLCFEVCPVSAIEKV